jgi:hypothetical protein
MSVALAVTLPPTQIALSKAGVLHIWVIKMLGGALNKAGTAFLENPKRYISGLFLAILCASIFFPYIQIGFISLRAEQLVTYALLILLPLALRRFPPLNRLGYLVALLLLFMLSATLAVTFLTGSSEAGSSPLVVIAGVDSIFFPVATLIVVAYLAHLTGRQMAIQCVAWVFIAFLVTNAIVAFIQPKIPTSILAMFWSGSDDLNNTVGKLSLDNDRFVGIFNQPIEAGIAYSLGLVLVCAVRLGPVTRGFLTISLVVGGGLSGSKVIWIGVLIGLVLAIFNAARDKKLAQASLYALTILPAIAILAWKGSLTGYFLRIKQSLPNAPTDVSGPVTDTVSARPPAASMVEDFLSGISGGRFGSGNGTSFSWSIFGNGFRQSDAPLDTAWIEFSTYAGIVGLLILLTLVGGLLAYGFRVARTVDGNWSPFLLTSIVAVASFGAGSLLLNRASTIFWISITILILTQYGNSASIPKHSKWRHHLD